MPLERALCGSRILVILDANDKYMKNMKKLFLLLLPLAFCACVGNDAECRISGVLDSDLAGNQVVLTDMDNNVVDSALIAADGTFVFNLGECEPAMRIAKLGGYECRVLVEKGLKVTLDLPAGKVEDGGVNSVYYGYFADRAELAAKYDLLCKDSYDESLSAECRDAARDEMRSISARMRNLCFERAVENKENLAGPAILLNYGLSFYAKSVAYYDSIVGLFPYAQYFNNYGREREIVVQKYISAEGSMFIDFDAKDWDGNAVKLSDYVGKGKYVLVDFWASWCGPCRGDIPNLNAIHDRFDGENFMVIGIDVEDNIAAAKDAAIEEGVKYTLLEANDVPVLRKYGISSIPHIILFAPDGTILKRGLRGEAIGRIVEEKLK